MRSTPEQRAAIIDYAEKHGNVAAAEHHCLSVDTIKSWRRRYGGNAKERANGGTHAEEKTGAPDDVSPAHLRAIAARLSHKLDAYLESGATVRIGPLSRAVGDLVRAAEKLATLPIGAGEIEIKFGQRIAQVIQWSLADLGVDDTTEAARATLRHRLAEASDASRGEIERLAGAARQARREAEIGRERDTHEMTRKALARFDEMDKSRRRNALADGCPTCGRGPESDAETGTTGSAPKALPAPDQHKQGPVAEHLIGAESETASDDDEVVEAELLENDEPEPHPHQRWASEIQRAITDGRREGRHVPEFLGARRWFQ